MKGTIAAATVIVNAPPTISIDRDLRRTRHHSITEAKSAMAVCWIRKPHANSTPISTRMMARGRRPAAVDEHRNHTIANVTGPMSRLSGSARLPSSIGEPMITAIASPPHSAARFVNRRDMPHGAAIMAASPLRIVSAWRPASLLPKSASLSP